MGPPGGGPLGPPGLPGPPRGGGGRGGVFSSRTTGDRILAKLKACTVSITLSEVQRFYPRVIVEYIQFLRGLL